MRYQVLYPTLERVQTASHAQLCYWHRFLDSPGDVVQKEIMDLLRERYLEGGGWTTELSKAIGWNPRDTADVYNL